MGLAYWSRLLRTVRYLRLRQIGYRVFYRASRPWIRLRILAQMLDPFARQWRSRWDAPRTAPRSSFNDGMFRFLGEDGLVTHAADWNSTSRSRLWLYNLHYLDDLNAADGDTRQVEQAALIERWIRDNPPPQGVGWEPYTLSLRLVNLVRWFSRHGPVAASWLSSLARQAQALSVQVEYHILGNHVFANGKGLVFAGAYLGGAAGDSWLALGLRILDHEFPEQFLDDGAHFELSPMYHATLLWDVCDLVNLAGRSGLPELECRTDAWRQVIVQGLDWLAAMCHPDGEISFFNDAAFGIAPTFGAIAAYAAQLGCVWASSEDTQSDSSHRRKRPEVTGGNAEQVQSPVSSAVHFLDSGLRRNDDFIRTVSIRHFSSSGYVVAEIPDGGKLLLDVARVGPDYQPGHAHADTLSFELSLFGQRVLVNSGTSRYGEDAERQRQRSTAAHNTVAIDGEDSSEVWAGFRVACRARPVGLSVAEGGGIISVGCAHDGYRRLAGRVSHRRQWRLSDQTLCVTDTIEGHFTEAVARFFLHPKVQVLPGGALLLANGQRLRWSSDVGVAQVVTSTWHPEFGATLASHCIEVRFSGGELRTSFFWG